jgi:outer membrane protein TolC
LDTLDEPPTLVALREAVKAQLPRADLLEILLEIAALEQHLNVVTVQATALTNESTAVNILGRRGTASVLLIKALGGSWNVSALPSAEEVTAQERPAESRP